MDRMMQEQQEPSVSDILVSIRQILSSEASSLDQKADSFDGNKNSFNLSEGRLESPVIPHDHSETDAFELTPEMRVDLRDSLISHDTALKAQESLQKLTDLSQGSISITPHQLNMLLKPLLKEWLDAHLPVVVERVVTDEVRRLINYRRS